MPFFDLPQSQLETYRSSAVAPADFDSFWAETLSASRSKPLDAVFEPVDLGFKLFDVFDVTFAGFGGDKIKGWYIKPAGSPPRGTVVKFIGYGGGRGLPQEHFLWPATGRAVLVMDTRGQGSGWSVGETPDPVGSESQQSGFMTKGITAPATYFYRRVFTDAVRAIEALRSRAEIDPARIATAGGSQGGALALAAASLDPSVKAVVADVPFLCDFPRAITIAPRNPYGEVARYLAVHRDMVERALATLNYFDVVNHVRNARATALISVAVMDTICPPSTVYAAFNAYAGAKRINSYIFNDHEGGGAFQEREQIAFLKEAL